MNIVDNTNVKNIIYQKITANYNAYNTDHVLPVTYLISSVKVTGGDGSSSNPFALSL